jgi:hypothetical protein
MRRKREVLEMLEAELARDPEVSMGDLHFLAGRVDSRLAELSEREFKKLYFSAGDLVLPTERKSAEQRVTVAKPGATPARPRPRKRKAAERRSRDAAARPAAGKADAARVRGVLNDFATDLLAADDPAAAVRVMARIDDYVTRILDG